MYDHIDLNILFRSIRIKLKKKGENYIQSLIVWLYFYFASMFLEITLYIFRKLKI
jgi:hypothetical protein